MMFLYILKSKNFAHTYVGITNDLNRRLEEHNLGQSNYTSKYRPWVMVYTETFDTFEQARAREKYFKSCVGRKLMKEYIPE